MNAGNFPQNCHLVFILRVLLWNKYAVFTNPSSLTHAFVGCVCVCVCVCVCACIHVCVHTRDEMRISTGTPGSYEMGLHK